jgi:NADPH2:quinone reductase
VRFLVEVRAAGINPSEAVVRSGALHHLFPATFPSGQGSDLAGVVAELGPGVSGFARSQPFSFAILV